MTAREAMVKRYHSREFCRSMSLPELHLMMSQEGWPPDKREYWDGVWRSWCR